MSKDTLIKILTKVNEMIPKKKVVSFCSIPDYSDNPRAIFEYWMKNCNKRDFVFVWHLLDKSNCKNIKDLIKKEYGNEKIKYKVVVKHSIRSIWYFFKSVLIIDSHGMYRFKADSQVELLTWHGMPLKKIEGLLHPEKQKKTRKNVYYSVTSSNFVEPFKKAFGAAEDQIFIDGQARNDYLDAQKTSFQKYKNYILFMPTFRKTNGKYHFNYQDCTPKENLFCNIDRDGWMAINDIMNHKDCWFIIKPHPSDSMDNKEMISDLNRVQILNDDELLKMNIPLYSFISGSIGLVTDYSSIVNDYLLTGKPVAYYIPDFDEYKKSRGFLFDNIKDTMVGNIFTDYHDLLPFLESPAIPDVDRYNSVCKFFNDVCVGDACKLIIRDIADIMKKEGKCDIEV